VPSSDPPTSRVTKGEIFLTYLSPRRQWTAVRDVVEVDGRPVLDREDFAQLLGQDDLDSVARRLFAVNARFNIGRIVRNFNDPLLALLALNDTRRSGFTFSVAAIDRSEPGTVLATLAFRERQRPTLVRSPRGAAVFSHGELLVEATTGTIRHARIALRYDGIEVELSTTFHHVARLDMWVPSTFIERYDSDRDGRIESIRCESTYTNYRRFEARGRSRDLGRSWDTNTPPEALRHAAAEPGAAERAGRFGQLAASTLDGRDRNLRIGSERRARRDAPAVTPLDDERDAIAGPPVADRRPGRARRGTPVDRHDDVA
jgi:hypothetical protein